MALRSSLCATLGFSILAFCSCGQNAGYSPSYSANGKVLGGKITYKIFVTARSDLSGSLFGTMGADLYCNADAQAGDDTYKALIGTNTRFAPSTDWPLKANTDYYRIDGSTLIGTTTSSAIFSGTLTNPVQTASVSVWTGLDAAFTNSNECTGFTATAGTGHIGLSNQATVANMIANGTNNCTGTMSLYCVQQ